MAATVFGCDDPNSRSPSSSAWRGIMGRRMVGNLLRHPQFTLTGAWDPAASARNTVAKEFSEVPIMGNASSLITSAETDLVYIACPPQWHKEYALAAIAAEKPIFCEKPLGVDVTESEDLVARRGPDARCRASGPYSGGSNLKILPPETQTVVEFRCERHPEPGMPLAPPTGPTQRRRGVGLGSQQGCSTLST